ncbi:MAG: hypothetical protein ACOY4R_01725 [Pseudomonadota bacterium]
MSDPPTDAWTFPERAPALRLDAITPMAMAIGASSAILALAVADAALRGPWLDEFWTLELSDGGRGLWPLIRDGWLRDAHPPLFNAWASLLATLGITSIPAGRLVSNLLAAGLLLLAAHRTARRSAGQADFAAVMVLLTLSLPQAMDSFALYRSYFWHIAAIGALALVARHVACAKADLDWRRDADLIGIAIPAAAASIGLHYVSGLFGGLLAGAIAACAFGRGLRRWTILLLATAAVSGLFVLASLALQAPSWALEFDHVWIEPGSLTALGVVASLAVTPFWVNMAPLAGLWLGGWTGRRFGERADTAADVLFGILIGGVVIVGLAIVLAVHAITPIVVDRYLYAVPVLVTALVAVVAARCVRHGVLFSLLALMAIADAARPIVETGFRPLWRDNAGIIAGVVASCPATRVYAASGWALGPAAETRAARREDPVFERAYRTLAASWGYEVHFLGQDQGAHATPGACPVLLWYEHTPNDAEGDARAAIAAAGLTGLEDARLSVTRSATGFVVRADARAEDARAVEAGGTPPEG